MWRARGFGERTGYAYTDDLSSERILHAARTAALIASGPAKTPVVGFQEKAARSLYPVTLPSVDAEITAKVELVMRADASARAYDPRIREVRSSYSDELRNILVVGSDGTFAEDSQPLARMNVSCIAKTEGNSARGSSGGGGRVALDFFFGEKTPEYFAKEAARQAILQLDAREAPAGEMEVVLGPGWPGVLLHEAIGHGLEADFNRKTDFRFCRAASASAWPAKNARSSTTAPCPGAADRSMWMTKVSPPRTPSSSKKEF